MQAAILSRYGGPEALELTEVPTPEVGPRDVLIEAHATSVNPIDAKLRAGSQRGVVRLRLPWILGLDVSGVVVARGPKVTRCEVGDEVFASPTHRRPGCYAEYVCADEDEVAPKPARLSHVEAASLPLVGLTAWRCLEPRLAAGPGQKVFIEAGAGGVGSFAIQLARARGAEVITSCSPARAELVRELGASEVVDYRSVAFDEVAAGCDLVLESVGGESRRRALRATRPGGQIASINAGLPANTERYGPTLGAVVTGLSLLGYMLRGLLFGVRVRSVVRAPDGEALAEIARLVDDGLIRPVLDRVLPLADVAQAHRLLEQGGRAGKIALAVRG